MFGSRFVLFSCCVVLCGGYSSGKSNDECGLNEMFSECIQSTCRHQECKEKTTPLFCPRVKEEWCIKGCVCKSAYRRDDSGVCVPEDECKPSLCQPNEEWSYCTQALCRAHECSDREKSIPCPSIPEGVCETGCVCQKTYLRTYLGCIPEDQCHLYE